jgi:hypothetical protein
LTDRAPLEGWSIAPHSTHQARSSTPELHQFQQTLWPMCENYTSPIRDTFLLQHLAVESLNASPLWLVRDGLVPLLWFFRSFPRPDGLKTRLLVHADFAPAVPPAWRSHVGTYEVVSLSPAPSAPESRPRLVVAGPLAESICTAEAFAAKLESLKSRIGAARLRTAETTLFLPVRHCSFQTKNADFYHALCLRKLFETCGGPDAKIRHVDWAGLHGADAFGGELLEVNDRLLCADNFLVHLVLSNGGRLPGKPKARPGKHATIFEISPNHGFLVSMTLRRDHSDATAAERDAITRAFAGPANRSYPWDAWMRPTPAR